MWKYCCKTGGVHIRTFTIGLAAHHLNSNCSKQTKPAWDQVADSLLLKPYASDATVADLECVWQGTVAPYNMQPFIKNEKEGMQTLNDKLLRHLNLSCQRRWGSYTQVNPLVFRFWYFRFSMRYAFATHRGWDEISNYKSHSMWYRCILLWMRDAPP